MTPQRGNERASPELEFREWHIDDEVYAQYAEPGKPGAWLRSTSVVPIED